MDNYPGNESAGAPAAAASAEEKPVREYRLCLYADGRAELKPMGPSGEEAEMAGMKEGFAESPGGGGMGAMV